MAITNIITPINRLRSAVTTKKFWQKNFFWFYLAGLVGLILISCFTDHLLVVTEVGIGDLILLVYLYLILLSPWLTIEQLIMVIAFLHSFEGVWYQQAWAGIKFYWLLALMAIGKSIYEVIYRYKTINFKMALPLMLLTVVMLLPVNRSNSIMIFSDLIGLGLIYVAYEHRDTIQFKNLVQALCWGLIVSGVLGMLTSVSPYLRSILQDAYTEDGLYRRFIGLTSFCNQYASLGLVALAGLLVLRYQKKIGSLNFYGLFVPVYIFAYQTVTRTFVLALAVLLVIYVIMCYVQDTQKFWRSVVPVLLVIVGTSVVFFSATEFLLKRIFEDKAMVNEYTYYHYLNKTDAVTDQIINGEIVYDPGRQELWHYYYQDWLTSFSTFFFGRGGDYPLYGCYEPHNAYLFYVWRNGFSSILLVGYWVLVMVPWRALKNAAYRRRSVVIILLAVPVLVQAFFDSNCNWEILTVIMGILLLRRQEQRRLALTTIQLTLTRHQALRH